MNLTRPSSIHSTYRYNYLSQVLSKMGKVEESPVEKTCVLTYPNFHIVFDMTDGVHDGLPFDETVGLHYKFLSTFKPKKYFYVKVNYSDSRSHFHVKLANESNGRVITCPKFSLYSMYTTIVNDRKKHRERRKSTKSLDLVTFTGTYSDFTYPNVYVGNEFKYPVTCTDASAILKKSVPISYVIPSPTRRQEIDSFSKLVKDPFKFVNHSKVSFNDYMKISIQSSATYHPNGIAIRHSVYENMCLGIPTIVASNAYIPDEIKKFCLIVDDSTSPKSVSSFVCSANEDEIIDFWECNMTPEKIVKRVFDQVLTIFQ